MGDEAHIDDDLDHLSVWQRHHGEPALEIKTTSDQREVDAAVALDALVIGSNDRADYIRSVAGRGGLSVAILQDEVEALCCLDHAYFFEKPFISLLIVRPDMRLRGLGSSLLLHNGRAFPEIWTSTNRSNALMRALLDKAGWRYCGELDGLDEGDPELFFKNN